jgi:enterobactin synthetase component D
VDLSQRIILPQATERFHPDRRHEYILGRVCASKAYEMCTGSELLSLTILPSRAPQWPQNVVGSISHDLNFVGAAVATKLDLLAIGIDFEVVGRTKPEVASRICNDEDIQTHHILSSAELLTVIFSAKESLYKALHPIVNVFFGFEAAAVREIDLQAKTFAIELLEPLSSRFSKHHRFDGRFIIEQGSCLTVIEVPIT